MTSPFANLNKNLFSEAQKKAHAEIKRNNKAFEIRAAIGRAKNAIAMAREEMIVPDPEAPEQTLSPEGFDLIKMIQEKEIARLEAELATLN